MSADNWTVCPKCEERTKEAKEHKELISAHGKIELAKSNEMQVKYQQEMEPVQSMREDYELGIREGVFEVSYSSYCETCKFEFKYKVSKAVV